MSIFASAKNFLFGSPKTMDDIFDKDTGHLAKIGGWIGNQQFTDQEQATMNANMAKAVQNFAIATLSENTDRSKARREIAVFTIKFYLLIIFIAGMVYPFNPEWSAIWVTLTTSWGLGLLVQGVAMFFFGVHVARHVKK